MNTATPGDLSARHLSESEMKWLLTSTEAMEALANYHDMQQCMGEAQGIDCSGNEAARRWYMAESKRIEEAWQREQEPGQRVFAALSALPAAGGAVAYGVRGGSGELWVCDFGLATIDKKNADGFIAWANEYRSADGPFAIVHFYTTPQPSAAEDAAAGAQGDKCFCDAQGIGAPGVSCGDCPRDYAAPADVGAQGYGVHGHRTMDDFPVSTSIPVADLAAQLRQYADPNCRECDGSGVWMGNVLVCSCILDNIPAAPAAGKGVDSEELRKLIFLWRIREDNGEELTEFDKGYEQASDEHAEQLEAALTRQPVAGDGMVLVPREQLSSLADILHDNRTTTDSGLPVTVLECIDVAQAAATEIRRLLAAAPAATPTDGGEG